MKRITVTSTVLTLAVICFVIIILTGDECDGCFSAPVMMVKFFSCGLVILFGSIYFTRKFLHFEKTMFEIETTPLLETNEAVNQTPFSCEGIIDQDKEKLFLSPYAGLPCVYYHSITEQQVGSGKNRRWVVIENLASIAPFYVKDERGRLKIDPLNMDQDFSGFKIINRNRMVPDPQNSEIDSIAVMKKALVYGSAALFGETVPVFGTCRRSEYILPTEAKVFVHGFVVKSGDELVLTESFRHPLLISLKSKEAFLKEFYKGKNLVYAVHFLAALGFTVAVLSANYFLSLSQPMLFTVIFTGNWILIISIIFTIYNRLVTLSQRAENSLYNIDVEFKRRAELVPKIVALVKEYANYEKELFELSARMRSHTEFLKSLPEEHQKQISPLTAIVEKYPDLKASENFKSLMNTFVDTEERIAYARAFYNRSVGKLNGLIAQFPFNTVAWFGDIKKMDFVSVVSE